MNKLKITITCLVTAFVCGCYYDNKEELYNTLIPDTTAVVSFAKDIAPIINSNCATSGCHAANGQTPALTNYAEIFSQKNRIKARAVDGIPTPMPTGGLMNTSNRNKIATWINRGAPNN